MRDCCAVIRHTLSQQSRPEDEHFFFRREMTYGARAKFWPLRFPYWLFWLLSDYGNSIFRPSLALAILIIATAMFYAGFGWQGLGQTPHFSGLDLAEYPKALGFSGASVFKFLGFQSTYYAEYLKNLSSNLMILSAAQTVVGYALLFFLGLGLRQRFRLR